MAFARMFLKSARSLPRLQAPSFRLHGNISLHQQSFRLFATDADLLKQFQKSQINRVSTREPRANELIKAIRNENYEQAKALVRNGVDVNGHTGGENTPLTDAAYRGDTKGVIFLLKELKANPHASCDCPYHKTALHYAAENGHTDTVKALLAHGANPKVLDNRKYTAIDVAKTGDVKKLLISSGGSSGKEVMEDKVKVRMYLPK